MRRLLPICLALLLLPAAGALAGPSKEFKSDGFQWSLPDDWSFNPVSAADRKNGFVAKAECDTASVEIFVYVAPTEDLPLGDRVQEILDGGPGVGSVVRSKVQAATLSGVKGRVVILKVDADGSEGHFRTYVITAGGKFYQMIVQCWHGAHRTVADGINAARAGFRLLEGAGGKDKAETLMELDDGKKSDGADSDDGMGADDDSSTGSSGPAGWPSGGPKLEGKTVKIHERNLEWTLPGDSPFEWRGAIEDVKAESGQFVVAYAHVERKKKEFEKGTPNANVCRLDVLIQPAPAGVKADSWVRGGTAQKNVERWKMFDEISTGKTRTKEKVKLGNHRGAFIKFEGKAGGKHSVLMIFTTVLRGDWFVFRAFCQGHTDAYKHLAPFVSKALKGVRFLETKEPQRGPLLIDNVPDFAGKRGTLLGKEKRITGPGYTFSKPKEIARLQVPGDAGRYVRFAGEGRSEDEKAYLYLMIQTFRLNISNTPNPKPETFIEKRAQAWLAGAGDSAKNSKTGKGPIYKKGGFGKAKGLTYYFSGELDKVPFVEEGWVVKHKSVMLWIQMQYGGVDAEKKLKSLIKAVKKGVKYKK